MYRVFGFLVLFALSGCAQVQLEHQSDSFNRASANSIGEHALLNAVRSSLDLPMSFTKLLKFTAGSMANGSFTPKLPFGQNALRVFDLGPSVNWSGGVSQIEYADVNNSGALAKLNTNLQYDTIDRYIYQSFELRVLGTLFVEYWEIHKTLLAALGAQFHKKCRNPLSAEDRYACAELNRLGTLCKAAWSEEEFFALEGGYGVVAVYNRGQSRCDFLKFQYFSNLLRLSGYWSDLFTETVVETEKSAEGKLSTVKREVKRQGIRFGEQEVQQTYDRLEAALKREAVRKKQAPKQALLFVLRSPKSLLTYLGELIALQNRATNPFVPEIMLASGQRLTIFRVVRGTTPPGPVALAVLGPDGERYFVPQPDYGSANRDQTLRVLALAGELVNGAISDKDFPAPASVVVRAFQ